MEATPRQTTPEPQRAVLARCASHLLAAQRRSEGAGDGATATGVELQLADAALRWLSVGERPRQLAILGPTQAGKSTVVNVLLGRVAAGVSPLAGFTVHADGFAIETPVDAAWTAALFPGGRRVKPEEFSREILDAYALRAVAAPAEVGADLFSTPAPWPAAVLWDTPDFDSLAARAYARNVVEIAALADIFLLVVSREKYADRAVWQMLDLLAPLGRPLLICLNKVTPADAEAVVSSLRERLAERGGAWGEVPVLTLPYDAELAAGRATGAAAEAVGALRAAVRGQLAEARVEPTPGVQRFVKAHWAGWTAPLRAEHAALAEFGGLLAAAGDEFLAAYERDYLHHPERYDAFRRAALELLNLLELPYVGGYLTYARNVVTWPMRRLFAAGRDAWAQRQPRAAGPHAMGAEATVLSGALDGVLNTLQRELARRASRDGPAGGVWRALAGRLADDEAHLRRAFAHALTAHHEQVQREIRVTANRLHAELQKQPARLTALRAGRATIDAGGLVLAIKSGGLAPLDAVWASAAFAFTSFLMEGMAGAQMQVVDRDLRRRQRAVVQNELVEKRVLGPLRGLSERLDGLLAGGLSPAELADADAALAAWGGKDG